MFQPCCMLAPRFTSCYASSPTHSCARPIRACATDRVLATDLLPRAVHVPQASVVAMHDDMAVEGHPGAAVHRITGARKPLKRDPVPSSSASSSKKCDAHAEWTPAL